MSHKPDRSTKAFIWRMGDASYWFIVLFDIRGHCEIHRDFDSFEDALALLPMLWRKG